jgi:uncharacterized caspase-like protein
MQFARSAFAPKAEVDHGWWYFRKVPIADPEEVAASALPSTAEIQRGNGCARFVLQAVVSHAVHRGEHNTISICKSCIPGLENPKGPVKLLDLTTRFSCFEAPTLHSIRSALLGTVILSLTCVTAFAEKRVALVIGNSAYKNVAPLDNPKHDAKLMADSLRELGFVLVGASPQIDLDKAGFEDILQKFGNELVGADVALFYYAGHGIQVRGSNYLVPVGANPAREADVLFQMVDTSLVLAAMEGSGTRLNLVILDACRNNPFGGRGLRTVESGLAQMRAPEGTLISYATQPGNVALDGTGGNSPYTKALSQIIRKVGLNVFQTFNEVGLEVMRATGNAQQPWVSTSPIKGNFQFVVSPEQAPAAPANTAGTNEAAQAWATIQNTTSVAVLETFVARFGDTFYGNAARARLEELKKQPIASARAPVENQKPLSASPQTALARTYEPNINREGVTISDFNLSSADPRLCQTFCIKNSQCTAWVYRAPEGRTDNRPHCWLRNKVTRSRGDNVTISGDIPR